MLTAYAQNAEGQRLSDKKSPDKWFFTYVKLAHPTSCIGSNSSLIFRELFANPFLKFPSTPFSRDNQ